MLRRWSGHNWLRDKRIPKVNRVDFTIQKDVERGEEYALVLRRQRKGIYWQKRLW